RSLALGVDRTSKANTPGLSNLRRERGLWTVLSFTDLAAGDPEVLAAAADTGASLRGPLYRATVFETAPVTTPPRDFKKRRMPITGRIELISAPAIRVVLLRRARQAEWRTGVGKVAG